jgi:hypothetical protein
MRKTLLFVLALPLLADVVSDRDRLELKTLEAEYYRLQLQADRLQAQYARQLQALMRKCVDAGGQWKPEQLACEVPEQK